MADCDELLADVRYRLEQAPAVYKHHYDKCHRKVQYANGIGCGCVFAIGPRHLFR
jgi:hypothetical protein